MPRWVSVCKIDDLQPDSGVCVLVEGRQIAIFHMIKDNTVYAIDNYDPIGKANVLSRGIVGDIKGEPVVASPLYKQHFNLLTGICLEDESIRVAVYGIRISQGRVEIQMFNDEATQTECSRFGAEAKV
ncbi:MAG: nitrite reductase small subunit NirD [Methylococcaceae bacterium]|nr:nitrite reductase small subunit NirD [Methylococcaceae bacterium]